MRVAVFVIFLALLAQPCSAGTSPYLIALMGQSNMVGRGELSDLPPGFPVNPTKLWNFTNAYKWAPAKEPIDSALGQIDLVSLDEHAAVGPSYGETDSVNSRLTCQLLSERKTWGALSVTSPRQGSALQPEYTPATSRAPATVTGHGMQEP